MGDLLQDFQKTLCPEYDTYDLPTKEAAHTQQQTWKATAPPPTHVLANSGSDEDEKIQKKGKKKVIQKTGWLNLNSYKLHSLGGYAKAIRQYGTTDNFNSQTVGVFFYEHYFLLKYFNSRVNLSINEGNGATSVFARQNILLALENKIGRAQV